MGERLGTGEFHAPGLPDRARKYVEGVFLRRINALAPECLEGLRRDVLPVFRAAQDVIPATVDTFRNPDRTDSWTVFSVLLGERCPRDLSNEWGAFTRPREAMWDWARGFNLAETWVVGVAAETVGFWMWAGTPEELALLADDPASLPRDLNWLHGIFNRSSIHTAAERRFTFVHPGWDLEIEMRGEFCDDLRSAFEKELEAYVVRMERDAESAGWERTRIKHGASNPLRHFDWLVRYQVQGWSFSEIARHYHVSRPTVTEYVEQTADRLRLRLRSKSRGGRPRKGQS